MPGAETKGRGRAATYVNAKLGYKKGGSVAKKGGGIIKDNKGMGVAK